MKQATIIYYTSNKEGSLFEQRVRDNILKVSGGLPIISVSQRPLDFGQNICVGDVGASGFNMFRQVLIACAQAKTPFVISAEADCLYPPDYFEFIPTREDICYRNSNLYVMGQWRKYFYKKEEGATHAQVVGQRLVIPERRIDPHAEPRGQQFRQRAGVVARRQSRREQGVNFALETLRAARMLNPVELKSNFIKLKIRWYKLKPQEA